MSTNRSFDTIIDVATRLAQTHFITNY